jgi:hypothetical protein
MRHAPCVAFPTAIETLTMAALQQWAFQPHNQCMGFGDFSLDSTCRSSLHPKFYKTKDGQRLSHAIEDVTDKPVNRPNFAGFTPQLMHQSPLRLPTLAPKIIIVQCFALPQNRQKTFACYKNCSLLQLNQPCLEAIQSSISDFASTEHRGAAGVRQLLPIQATVLEELLPFLLLVVALATKVVAFPFQDPVIHDPVIVVAPPSSSHSNGWSKGALHRNFDCTKTTGVCSFLLFLDEVTTKNGTVTFWRHSKSIWPVDPRHPERALG